MLYHASSLRDSRMVCPRLFHMRLPMTEISTPNEPESKSGLILPRINTNGSVFSSINKALSPIPLCSVCLRPTNTSCTPARRTHAFALLFNQYEYVQAQRTQHISFKKNGGIPEMFGQ